MYPPSGWLFGPIEVDLDSHQAKSCYLTHGIPVTAATGTYTYYGYVGFSDGIIDEEQFNFQVTVAAAAVKPQN